jgi:hypothetical protein
MQEKIAAIRASDHRVIASKGHWVWNLNREDRDWE